MALGQWLEIAMAAAGAYQNQTSSGEDVVRSIGRTERQAYQADRNANIRQITDNVIRAARAFYMVGIPVEEAIKKLTPPAIQAFEELRSRDIDPNISMQPIPALIGQVYKVIEDYPTTEGPAGYKEFISLSEEGRAKVIARAKVLAAEAPVRKVTVRPPEFTQPAPGAPRVPLIPRVPTPTGAPRMGGAGMAMLAVVGIVGVGMAMQGGGAQKGRRPTRRRRRTRL